MALHQTIVETFPELTAAQSLSVAEHFLDWIETRGPRHAQEWAIKMIVTLTQIDAEIITRRFSSMSIWRF